MPGAFEIAPGPLSGALMALLHARGYRQTRFHAAFAGPAELPQQPSAGVEVRRVEERQRPGGLLGRLSPGLEQHRVPGADEALADRARLVALPRPLRWPPAGAALLCLADGDAYLADSAVDPKWRRRGVHRALLDRRCADAAAAGAQVVFSGADYLSASHLNMLRKGLSLLFTKAIWTAGAP